MVTEKKIFLDRNDGLEAAVHHLINTNAHLVVLNIPRDSLLGESLQNFHILKREGATAGKELLIESVDERILELAGLARLPAMNPIFRKEERIISDILPKPKFIKAPPKKELEPVSGEEKEEAKAVIVPKLKPKLIRSQVSWGRKITVLLIIFLILGGGFFLLNNILPKATVFITLKKIPTSFAEEIEVSSEIIEVKTTLASIALPGEFLTARRNRSAEFTASGREEVKNYAKGTLTVVNAYSSAPQTLVEKTRFLSPQGKVFRLDQKVIVPGAKIQNGKVIPSEIEVKVTADLPGEESNLPPVENWRIPGFAGSPRYDGFYGISAAPMSGGFIGRLSVATSEDIEKGKETLKTSLAESLRSEMLILLSSNLKIFEEAQDFKIIREEIGPADPNGNFSIFMEAEMNYLVFEEKTLKETIAKKVGVGLEGDLRVRDFSVNYGEKKIDFNKKKMSFRAEGTLVFESRLDENHLKAQLFGQNEEELRQVVFFLPGLERAKIKLWPFWVKRVPSNPGRLEIKID